jgi:hypothetical protein
VRTELEHILVDLSTQKREEGLGFFGTTLPELLKYVRPMHNEPPLVTEETLREALASLHERGEIYVERLRKGQGDDIDRLGPHSRHIKNFLDGDFRILPAKPGQS